MKQIHLQWKNINLKISILYLWYWLYSVVIQMDKFDWTCPQKRNVNVRKAIYTFIPESRIKRYKYAIIRKQRNQKETPTQKNRVEKTKLAIRYL